MLKIHTRVMQQINENERVSVLFTEFVNILKRRIEPNEKVVYISKYKRKQVYNSLVCVLTKNTCVDDVVVVGIIADLRNQLRNLLIITPPTLIDFTIKSDVIDNIIEEIHNQTLFLQEFDMDNSIKKETKLLNKYNNNNNGDSESSSDSDNDSNNSSSSNSNNNGNNSDDDSSTNSENECISLLFTEFMHILKQRTKPSTNVVHITERERSELYESLVCASKKSVCVDVVGIVTQLEKNIQNQLRNLLSMMPPTLVNVTIKSSIITNTVKRLHKKQLINKKITLSVLIAKVKFVKAHASNVNSNSNNASNNNNSNNDNDSSSSDNDSDDNSSSSSNSGSDDDDDNNKK